MPPLSTTQRISNLGRYTTVFDKKSYGSADNQGYMQCKIHKRSTGESMNKKLHRLVCIAFHGLPPPNCEVDHVNGNISDATASNLEWVSHQENVRRSFDTSDRKANAESLGKPVRVRSVDGGEWVQYKSVSDACRSLELPISGHASRAIKSGSPYSGYIFEKVNMESQSDLEGEEWRSIPDTDWFVSNKGRVRRPDGKVTLGSLRKDGFRKVNICGKIHDVKQLVAAAFTDIVGPSPSEKHCLTFLDLDSRGDSSVSNLCWRTRSEIKTLQHANGCKKGAEKEKKPVFTRKSGSSDPWRRHPSQADCAAAIKMSPGTLSAALKTGKSSKGFDFSLQPEEDIEGEIWKEIEEEWIDAA